MTGERTRDSSAAPKTFRGNFTQQEPIPEEAIARAIEVMRSGRLHRYNVADGELSETALLEQAFARYMGVEYCLACASGGYALQTALKAFGLRHGEPVVTNAFTLSPVPGAIVGAGGKPVLVETTDNLVIDLDDLEAKIRASGARVLRLSHMRGHIVNMDALLEVTNAARVGVIEDCAHTMGAAWRGTKSGLHGIAACYSTQTYKHINSGEGGFLISRDRALMARAVILSGSYMLYERHLAAPGPEAYPDIRLDTPNCSGRMDNLRAAILHAQLERLDDSVRRWNERYRAIELTLRNVPGVKLTRRPDEEFYVGSSFQFMLPEFDAVAMEAFLARCKSRGVEVKWFGAPEPAAYTSRHDSWRYLEPQSLPRSDAVLAMLCDLRLPLTFTVEDCSFIGEIIRDCVFEMRASIESGSSQTQSA
ncbi:MAG: DegT/DnrJ/EryC1/StrS family aminotransferase [Gammaproteobacteria bacterium]